MRKVLITALGLIAVGALVAAQPADARRKGPPVPVGIGGGKPPAFPAQTSGASQAPVDPRVYGPRPHPQPTDPLPK